MHNPFHLLGAQPTGMMMQQPQPTGFMMPQHTAFQQQSQQQSNPFNLQQQQQQQQHPQHPPFSSFLQPQPQNMNPTGFLQPQPTGSNPFRQSMMFTQSTGFPSQQPQPFAMGGQGGPSPFSTPSSSPFASSGSSSAFGGLTAFSASPFPPFSQYPAVQTEADLPARPASTPLTSFGSLSSSQQAKSSASPPEAQPLRTHQTGSRNPFGIPVTTPPPVPKQPTLMELAMASSSSSTTNTNSQGGQNGVNGSQPTGFDGMNAFNTFNAGGGGGDMASVASSFSFKPENKTGISSGLPGTLPSVNFQNTAATTTSGSVVSDSLFSSSLSSQPTGATSTPSVSSPTLKPQMTGFSGLKPFKPTSSFGASLLESLPPIPGSNSNLASTANENIPAGMLSTPSSAPGGLPSFGAGSGFNSPSPGLGSQPTSAPFGAFGAGSSLGVGLRPQMTGAGTANPFRVSMLAGPSSGPMNGSLGAFPGSTSSPSGFGGRSFSSGPSSPWSGGPFGAFGGGALGSGPTTTSQDSTTQQSKQNGS